MTHSGVDVVEGVALVAGRATGSPLVLDEPLSFWGGVSAETGAVIDTHHPQVGASVAGRVLVMPRGRGSSSSSSVLAETIRGGVGPTAIVLGTADPILVIGCLVAAELYDIHAPVVVLELEAYVACTRASELRVLSDGDRAVVEIVA